MRKRQISLTLSLILSISIVELCKSKIYNNISYGTESSKDRKISDNFTIIRSANSIVKIFIYPAHAI